MEKDFYYIELFETYKGLLTAKQADMFNSHYLLDLSYAEIAETEGTSRQSIFDAIKKVKEKLDEYENILHLRQKTEELNALAESIGDKQTAKKIKEIAGR